MFQRNRNKILDWLELNPHHRNAVMDAVVQLVEEGSDSGGTLVAGGARTRE